MNVQTAVRTALGKVPVDSLVREIRLEQIAESKTNPRSRRDETALAERAAGNRQQGVLQPVLVRLHPDGTSTFSCVMTCGTFAARMKPCGVFRFQPSTSEMAGGR
ncbi:MAG: ParB N-terminal domain-containing protein [Candidatus Acidiferrum sp.]